MNNTEMINLIFKLQSLEENQKKQIVILLMSTMISPECGEETAGFMAGINEFEKCNECGDVNDDLNTCNECAITLCLDCDENEMPCGPDEHTYCTPCVQKLFKESDYEDEDY